MKMMNDGKPFPIYSMNEVKKIFALGIVIGVLVTSIPFLIVKGKSKEDNGTQPEIKALIIAIQNLDKRVKALEQKPNIKGD